MPDTVLLERVKNRGESSDRVNNRGEFSDRVKRRREFTGRVDLKRKSSEFVNPERDRNNAMRWINPHGVSPEFVTHVTSKEKPRNPKRNEQKFPDRTSDVDTESSDLAWLRNLPNPEFVFPDQLPRRRKQVDLDVPFPISPVPQAPRRLFVPSGCSEDEEFCEAPRDYPDHDLIKKLVKNKTSQIEAQLLFGSPASQGYK